ARTRRPSVPTAWTCTARRGASPRTRRAGSCPRAGDPGCCPGCTRAAPPGPARALLDKGVAVALGSDHSPGGIGITSMALVISLAVSYLVMTVEEALRAATIGGAHALRAPDRGAMVRGRLADMVLWDADHEGAFVWSYGLAPRRVWRGGEPVVA